MSSHAREVKVCENIKCVLHGHYIKEGTNSYVQYDKNTNRNKIINIFRWEYHKGGVSMLLNICEDCAIKMTGHDK